MAGEDAVPAESAPEEVRVVRFRRTRAVTRWAAGIVLALLAILTAAVVFLHTPPGRQFIVEEIAKVAPASGLAISVDRIQGSVLWSATLHGVEFRDADGVLFLEVPEVELNWRPIRFFFTGLDVRNLVLHDGILHAVPRLEPGDPDAPILPDFDIRVDRFVVDNLTVAEGILGEERVIDYRAEADIRDGRVYLNSSGVFGGGDTFDLLADVEPDGDRFNINFDYRAPAGGFLAALAGAEQDLRLRLTGDGNWDRWDGRFLGVEGEQRIADFEVLNRAGRYTIAGRVRPQGYLTGLPGRALGESAVLVLIGTLEDSVASGAFAIRGRGVRAGGQGAIDLANNAFRDVTVDARLRDPNLFGADLRLEGAAITAFLDGPFRDLVVPHRLTIDRADVSGTVFAGVEQRGTLTWDGTRLVFPLDARIARITSGNELLDPRLVNGVARGTLLMQADRLMSDNIALRFPGLWGDLDLRADLAQGSWAFSGPVEMRGVVLENIGTVDAGAKIVFRVGAGVPWRLDANFTGRLPTVTNDTLANLAGTGIRFDGGVTLGGDRPLVFRQTRINASKLSLLLDGTVRGGETTLAGSGRHVDYGPFTVEATLTGEGPRAALVFAEPLPAAGLRDVRVALAPTPDGFAIETEGQSTLGPFEGRLLLHAPPGAPTRIAVESLRVWQTNVTGELVLGDAVSGDLALSGGGINGTIGLAPRGGGQGFTVDLSARDARFGGETPLGVRRAEVDVSGVIVDGSSTISGTMQAQGLSYGTLFIGQLAARAEVTDGVGRFDAALAGRRGSRFELRLAGNVAPERISVAARGNYAGREISMPRRAVLLRLPDGGWQLQRSQLTFGEGAAIAEGRFGGDGSNQGRLSLARMPLALIDLVGGDVGLGGTISGVIDFDTGAGGAPTGEARVLIDDLTRSGLLLTSRPVDLALVARLSPTLLQTRAILRDEGGNRGRLQGRIANLPAGGPLFERLQRGDLFAQVRYEGPADSLWRLAAVDALDLTGTLRVAADVRGTLLDPEVRGTLAGDSLRVQSILTGTDLREVRARGRFSGSVLRLTSFQGQAPNGGAVTGSGTIDLSNLEPGRGPAMDIRLAARDAEILDLATMSATVTGPMRIVSSGVGGTIAGRLRVNEARWRLGAAAGATELPDIRVREINAPADVAPAAAPGAPWRYLIDAEARDRVMVEGMGLDSEWSADIVLRGTTSDPRIGGIARVVPRSSSYSFAGNRFDIVRGVIDFNENVPPDPRLGILAQTQVEGLTVRVSINGSASRPEIAFDSTPALPEEEILARLLFGGSIASVSATDALQLGAAIASLRGGSGVDPINKLREAVGLDRLRIVPADPALDRGTSLALGKRFGRRFYAEIITDGRGYNATSVEFRITSWLALLASISSLGRESVSLEYSRDY